MNKFRPEIIENYHNSGRTALIFPFTAEALKEYWKSNSTAPITIHVKINGDAKPGTVRNYAYVVGDNLDEYDLPTGGTEDIYDLNDNGRTDDKIAYDYSDAIIVAAESLYAEKFIAPAGSSNWTKQGLNMKVGSQFDYQLKVTNDMSGEYTGLIVYDALPNIGDEDVFQSAMRKSEFPVRLRGAITPPEGYRVYYTTSPAALTKSMDEMLADDSLWVSQVSDYSQVTAFQLVAEEGTRLAAHSSFTVRVPVCVVSQLSQESIGDSRREVRLASGRVQQFRLQNRPDPQRHGIQYRMGAPSLCGIFPEEGGRGKRKRSARGRVCADRPGRQPGANPDQRRIRRGSF